MAYISPTPITMKTSTNALETESFPTNPARRIYNPIQKDAAIFIQTTEESGGITSIVDIEVAPGGGNGLHYHNTFDEHFTVISGEFGVQIGKQQFTLKQGESAVAPMKVLHRWYNPSAETAVVRVELKPGNTGFERCLQIAYGLARDGLVNSKAIPTNIHHLAILLDLGDTGIPGVFSVIAPIMRMIAKRARKKGIERQLIEKYCLI